MQKYISKFWTWGFLQALGAGVVVWLWSLFMTNLQSFMDTTNQPEAHNFVVIPLIFIITAVLAAGAVLGWPIYLALKSKWNEAVALTLLTVVWLGVFSAILIGIF